MRQHSKSCPLIVPLPAQITPSPAGTTLPVNRFPDKLASNAPNNMP